jgi:hypothetical protein
VATLNDYARDLLTEQLKRNGGSVTPAVRGEMEVELVGRLNDFINRRTLESMDEATLARFEAFVDSDPPATEIQRFVEANVPNKVYIVSEALKEFRKLYLGL